MLTCLPDSNPTLQYHVPTVGGNHEASNYLWELFYGGWAAPNIYFLGYSGAVRFGGHLIAGLSGTYVAPHYGWGHHEQLPYDERMVKSAYHVRQLHVHRLMQVRVHVCVGGGWGEGVAACQTQGWQRQRVAAQPSSGGWLVDGGTLCIVTQQ